MAEQSTQLQHERHAKRLNELVLLFLTTPPHSHLRNAQISSQRIRVILFRSRRHKPIEAMHLLRFAVAWRRVLHRRNACRRAGVVLGNANREIFRIARRRSPGNLRRKAQRLFVGDRTRRITRRITVIDRRARRQERTRRRRRERLHSRGRHADLAANQHGTTSLHDALLHILHVLADHAFAYRSIASIACTVHRQNHRASQKEFHALSRSGNGDIVIVSKDVHAIDGVLVFEENGLLGLEPDAHFPGTEHDFKDKELGLVNVGVVTVKNTCYPSNKQQRIAFWRRQVLLHLRNYFLDEATSEFYKLARFGNHHFIVVQIHHNHAVQIVLAIFRLELIGRNAENVRERRLQEQ